MEVTEKRQRDYEENFIKEADEAKEVLHTIEKDIRKKSDKHSHTLDRVKEKCLN